MLFFLKINLRDKNLPGKAFSILIVFLAILVFYACSGVSPQNDPEKQERKIVFDNQIQSITEWKSSFFAGVKQKEFPVHFRKFDKTGLLKNEVLFTHDSLPDSFVSYWYNTSDNMDSCIALNADSSLLYRVVILYNEKGRRRDYYFYLPDGSYKYRNVSTYDDTGKLKELSWYWPDGFKAKNVYEYKQDRLIKDTEFGPGGEFRYRWDHNYDASGNKILSIQTYPDDKVTSRIEYNYNASGQLIEEVHLNGTEFQSRTAYHYDSKGLLSAKEEMSASGRIISASRFEYKK